MATNPVRGALSDAQWKIEVAVPRDPDDISVIMKTYDFTLWLWPHLANTRLNRVRYLLRLAKDLRQLSLTHVMRATWEASPRKKDRSSRLCPGACSEQHHGVVPEY
jgi:hypothetical protein